jgi:hypothetical protein
MKASLASARSWSIDGGCGLDVRFGLLGAARGGGGRQSCAGSENARPNPS